MSSPTSPHAITVTNRLEKSAIGVVRLHGLDAEYRDPEFDHQLASLLDARTGDLPPDLEHVRLESRNMLRNGVYKPTGRGKPASEYLLRAARDPESFPRINWPVDVCNFVSLKYLMPVSIWDVDAAGTSEYVFRLGRPDEKYVFNTAGQVIALQDLAVGCSVFADRSADGMPIVNPVKDSMKTKTGPSTVHVAGAIYAPAHGGNSRLDEACAEFAGWLDRTILSPESVYRILNPGESHTC
jgi:DNA/RNA-binding domain of Phe-tRNA-synthetase-like protein